jgi:hypothetical protein
MWKTPNVIVATVCFGFLLTSCDRQNVEKRTISREPVSSSEPSYVYPESYSFPNSDYSKPYGLGCRYEILPEPCHMKIFVEWMEELKRVPFSLFQTRYKSIGSRKLADIPPGTKNHSVDINTCEGAASLIVVGKDAEGRAWSAGMCDFEYYKDIFIDEPTMIGMIGLGRRLFFSKKGVLQLVDGYSTLEKRLNVISDGGLVVYQNGGGLPGPVKLYSERASGLLRIQTIGMRSSDTKDDPRLDAPGVHVEIEKESDFRVEIEQIHQEGAKKGSICVMIGGRVVQGCP